MRELREEGKLVSKKQLEIQVIKMWNKELPYKEIQKKIKKDYNKDININHIINSFGKRIKKLSEKYEGQDVYLEQFEEYIFGCKRKLENGDLNKQDLEIIKDVVVATEKFQYIIFYIKATVRLEEFDEALKMIQYQTNNEFFTKEERTELAKLKEKLQMLVKNNNAKKMLKRGISVKKVMDNTGLLETQVLAIRRNLIQEQQRKKQKRNIEDNGERLQ